MNKDLDSRIIPNGEYRNAENISISTSEGSDVGALENIRGNIQVTKFGLTDHNLKIIGSCVDATNNRIFFFITNNYSVDTSFSSPSGEISIENVGEDGVAVGGQTTFIKSGAKHYIAMVQIQGNTTIVNENNVTATILVSGNFLNFSTLNPIINVNILENLLFWTDNRNQPRKINIEKALSDPSYYSNEDHISVAKYAPYTAISFLEDEKTKGAWSTDGVKTSTLKNEKDKYLPPHIISPATVSGNELKFPESIGDEGGIGNYLFDGDISLAVLQGVDIKVTCEEFSGEAFLAGIDGDDITLKTSNQSTISDIQSTLGWTSDITVKFQSKNNDYNRKFSGDKNFLKEKFIRFSYRFKYDDGEYSIIAPFSQHAFIPKQYGYFIGDDADRTAESSIVDFMENQVTTAGLIIDLPCAPNELKEKLHIEEIQLLYKASDEQSIKVIADVELEGDNIQGLPKKISLVSPLNDGDFDTGYDQSITNQNQHNFTPVFYQEGSNGAGQGMQVAVWINGNDSDVGPTTGPPGTVHGFVSREQGLSQFFCVSKPGHGYKIGDILTIRNPDVNPLPPGFKIKIEELDNKFYYSYKSQKPIKVLPEKEIVRVSDIVPIRAKTQEIVGNRVVYGNFLQNNKTPSSLKYKVKESQKGIDTSLSINKELINHTLKQNRTYQVGIVLQDRYGRASNVIINSEPSSSINFSSTYFSPYSNGGVDPLSWPGNSLNVIFQEQIDTLKTDDYNGVWSEENPLGWYSYKIVVKQQEQDYYNVYFPGSLSGNVVFTGYSTGGEDNTVTPLTYSKDDKVSHVVLFNDNINKIPRDLNKVGPSDKIYSSNVVLHSRVKNVSDSEADITSGLSEQSTIPGIQTVTNIRPFGEMGDWTKYKNVDLHYLNMDPDPDADPRSQYPLETFIYPGSTGNVDPLYLENNKNPLVATLKTDQRIGYASTKQVGSSFKFSKFLTIFETEPVKSEIDIYYETSSSGTIAHFNSRIGDVLPDDDDQEEVVLIDRLSTIQFNEWTEEMIEEEPVTNTFQARDSANNTIGDSTVLIEIEECFIVSDSGNATGVNLVTSNLCPFTCTTQEQGSFPALQPTFVIKTNRQSIYPLFGTGTEGNSLRLTLKATSESDQTGKSFVLDDISLTNISPKIMLMKRPAFSHLTEFDNRYNDFDVLTGDPTSAAGLCNWQGRSPLSKNHPTNEFSINSFPCRVVEEHFINKIDNGEYGNASNNNQASFFLAEFIATTNGSDSRLNEDFSKSITDDTKIFRNGFNGSVCDFPASAPIGGGQGSTMTDPPIFSDSALLFELNGGNSSDGPVIDDDEMPDRLKGLKDYNVEITALATGVYNHSTGFVNEVGKYDDNYENSGTGWDHDLGIPPFYPGDSPPSGLDSSDYVEVVHNPFLLNGPTNFGRQMGTFIRWKNGYNLDIRADEGQNKKACLIIELSCTFRDGNLSPGENTIPYKFRLIVVKP